LEGELLNPPSTSMTGRPISAAYPTWIIGCIPPDRNLLSISLSGVLYSLEKMNFWRVSQNP